VVQEEEQEVQVLQEQPTLEAEEVELFLMHWRYRRIGNRYFKSKKLINFIKCKSRN
jgi:hypothetical protein